MNKYFNISYSINLLLIKFYKWKIDNFLKKNSIDFIVSHYDENFDYINLLPKNQNIYIYVKKINKRKLITLYNL